MKVFPETCEERLRGTGVHRCSLKMRKDYVAMTRCDLNLLILQVLTRTQEVDRTPLPSSDDKNDENYIGREHCNDGASDGTDLLQVH